MIRRSRCAAPPAAGDSRSLRETVETVRRLLDLGYLRKEPADEPDLSRCRLFITDAGARYLRSRRSGSEGFG